MLHIGGVVFCIKSGAYQRAKQRIALQEKPIAIIIYGCRWFIFAFIVRQDIF